MGDNVFRKSLGLSLWSGVSTTPGATTFTRMPSFAYSIARLRVTAFRPPFVIIGTAALIPAIGLSTSDEVTVTMLPPRLLGQHLLDRELGDVKEPFEVGRHERLEIPGRVVGEWLGEEDPRVVDERVDGPESVDGCRDDPGGGRRLADVAVDQGDPPGLGEATLLRDVARVRNDRIALFQQCGDHASPDALRGSRHDRRLRFPRHDRLPNACTRVRHWKNETNLVTV